MVVIIIGCDFTFTNYDIRQLHQRAIFTRVHVAHNNDVETPIGHINSTQTWSNTLSRMSNRSDTAEPLKLHYHYTHFVIKP